MLRALYGNRTPADVAVLLLPLINYHLLELVNGPVTHRQHFAPFVPQLSLLSSPFVPQLSLFSSPRALRIRTLWYLSWCTVSL